MKAAEADILIIPGLGNSGPDHWQSRWEARLSTARRVPQGDWMMPDRETWAARVADAVNHATRPVVLVAHSLGVPTAINAIPHFKNEVRGAFLVAPPDLDSRNLKPRMLRAFGPYPREPLPFPSITVASRNDGYCEFGVAEDLAAAWGSLLVDAGDAGHINTDSGYGPWPEGSLTFAKLLSRL